MCLACARPCSHGRMDKDLNGACEVIVMWVRHESTPIKDHTRHFFSFCFTLNPKQCITITRDPIRPDFPTAGST